MDEKMNVEPFLYVFTEWPIGNGKKKKKERKKKRNIERC